MTGGSAPAPYETLRTEIDEGVFVITLDRADAAGRLAEAQARMLSATPQHDWQGRAAEEVSPLSLPVG